MPNVSIQAGGFVILGSRSDLPPGTGTLDVNIAPLQVNADIAGGTLRQVSTIANAPLITVQGTVTTGGVTIGTLSIGTITLVQQIGTILNAPVVTVQGTVSTGGVASTGTVTAFGTITVQAMYGQVNILTNQTVTSTGSQVITMATLQALVIDVVYGNAVSGSIITFVTGVEPQSGVFTSTILSGDWFASSSQSGQRLQLTSPLGYSVAVNWAISANATITGVYTTAVKS